MVLRGRPSSQSSTPLQARRFGIQRRRLESREPRGNKREEGKCPPKVVRVGGQDPDRGLLEDGSCYVRRPARAADARSEGETLSRARHLPTRYHTTPRRASL